MIYFLSLWWRCLFFVGAVAVLRKDLPLQPTFPIRTSLVNQQLKDKWIGVFFWGGENEEWSDKQGTANYLNCSTTITRSLSLKRQHVRCGQQTTNNWKVILFIDRKNPHNFLQELLNAQTSQRIWIKEWTSWRSGFYFISFFLLRRQGIVRQDRPPSCALSDAILWRLRGHLANLRLQRREETLQPPNSLTNPGQEKQQGPFRRSPGPALSHKAF